METIVHAGLSNAISATFLALLVACLGRVLARRPAVLHCLWLLVLLKLVTPPLYEVPISLPEALKASEAPDAAKIELALLDPAGAISLLDADLGERFVVNELPREFESMELVPIDDRPTMEDRVRAVLAAAGGWIAMRWMPIVAGLWLAGTVATMLISVRRIRRFQVLLREARPGSDSIQNWVDGLAARLGVACSPQVWWIDGKLSPMLWALFGAPRLIIPLELWKSLDQRQRGTLLVHELAHLRRGDHRVRLFELLVTALYWWNPVLWWARRRLRDVEEQCCDAWVVWVFPEAAKSYAETLLETLDFLNRSELAQPLLASGFGKAHHLRRRLTMIMSGTTPRLVSAWGALGALALGALLLPVNATWAQTADDKKEVRVVVTTDDDGKAVVSPSGKTEVTSTFLVTADCDASAVQTIVLSADPVLVTGGAGVETGFVVTDDEKSNVQIVIKTDDSSITVTADSIEDALKKLAEQIRTLRTKTASDQKAKAQQEVLLQVVKQLDGQLAEQKKETESGKGEQKSQMRFVTRTVENVMKQAPDNPAKKAQIDKARARIEELSKALGAAQADLAKLEGNETRITVIAKPSSEFKFGGKLSENKNIIIHKKADGDAKGELATAHGDVKVHGLVTKDVKVRSGKPIEVRTFVHGKSEGDRIDALEQKLNKLLEEVASLKKSKSD